MMRKRVSVRSRIHTTHCIKSTFYGVDALRFSVWQTYLKTESVGNPWPRDMSTITAPLTTHLSFYKAFSSQPFIREASTAQPLNVHTSFESFFRKSFRARTTVQNMFFREKVTSKEILKRRVGATFVIVQGNSQTQRKKNPFFELQ